MGDIAVATERRRAASRPNTAVTHVLLAIGAMVMLAPFVWQILTSFKTFAESVLVPPTILPAAWAWESYAEVFSSIPFLGMLSVTLLTTAARVVGTTLLAAMAAYAFARIEFRGREVLFAVFLSTMMIPDELLILPQYEIVAALGWLNHPIALIVPRLFGPFGVFLLRQFFLSIPREIEEAAQVDGANRLRIFVSIMLPMARPGMMALGILLALASWKDLLWPLIVTTDRERMPLSVGLATLKGEFFSNYPVMMAGALMAMLPIIAVFAIFQRQFIEGIELGSQK